MSASAGSGKTYSLAYEYVRNVIANPSLYSHILAVTFTNKATAEMKERILASINDLANGYGGGYRNDLGHDLNYDDTKITARAREARSKILHDYGRFAVMTIDAFSQRIIRAFLRELGIGINFNLELHNDTLLGKATDRILDLMPDDDRLRSLVAALVNEKIDDGSSWNVKKEIESLGGQIFSEEYKTKSLSAGTAEDSRALLGRLSTEAAKAKNALAKAGKDIIALLERHGIDYEDINAGKNGVWGYITKIAAGELKDYSGLANVTKVLNTGKWHKDKSSAADTVMALESQLNGMLQELCRLYDDGIVLINTATIARKHYSKLVLLDDLRQKVTEISREENVLYISEVNDLLARLVAGNDAPFIYEKAGNRFSHFMIDEFQDTSAMQWENFVPLLQNAVAQSEASPVLLVGDIKQSIYRWRGGDWSILAGKAAERFRETKQTSLQTNYRSREVIVQFINGMIGRCATEETARLDFALTAAKNKGSISEELHRDLISFVSNAYSDYEQQIPEGKDGGYITITHYEKNVDGEAVPPVIELIEDLQSRGYAPRDIAILVRTKREGNRLAEMLLEHKRLNPQSPHSFDVITQEALVIGKAAIAGFVTACMRLSSNTDETIARAQYNHWLGRGFADTLPDAEQEFFASLQLMPPEEALESIIRRYDLGERPGDTAYLQALHRQVVSFSEKNIADIPLFLQWWDEKGAVESISLPEGANAITIDTIHKTKGLGFKAVILPYCNWSMNPKTNSLLWAVPAGEEKGLFPVGYEKMLADSAFSQDFYREYVMSHIDSLNLFYVAVTRAKEELHIMIPPPGRSPESIDTLIDAAVTVSEDKASLGGFSGEYDGARNVISFGEPCHPVRQPETDESLHIHYRSYAAGDRIKLKLSGQRYFDEHAPDSRLAPRDYGILMHGVFENASDLLQIENNIEEMRSSGALSAKEADKLTDTVSEALSDGLIRSWFDGSWEEVHSEDDIILPGGGSYRPDRVMAKTSETIIVDYKFGLTEDPRHVSQVARYSSLLTQMGYQGVKGYIWYIGLKKVVTI